MSDLELLFLVLACVYSWECVCWLPRGSVALRTWLGRRWHIVHPGTLLANQHGGFILAPPLPPLGNFISGNQLPVSLSPEAVLAYVSPNLNPGWRPPQSGRLLPFDRIEIIEGKGKKVMVNREVLLKTSSSTSAQYLARTLSHLKKTAPAERPAVIEKIFRDSFDEKDIQRRWQEFAKRNRPLRWLANTLFFYLFLLAPMVIGNLGLRFSWPGLLGGLLVLTTSTAICFRRAHRALYPDAEDDRFTHFLTILLSPASAIRAQDVLSRPLLEAFHPLAIVQVFGSREVFQKLAEKVLLEIRFPALPVSPDDSVARAVETYSRSALQKIVAAYLVRNGLDPDELVKPPRPADESCRTYCPHCRAQFTVNAGACADCGGLPLVAFPVH